MQEEGQTDETMEGFYPFQRGDKWFAVDVARGIELAPVFDSEAAAEEVGRKCFAQEPFFDRIPCVPAGTANPRPQGVFWKPHKLGKVDLTPPPPRPNRLHRERRALTGQHSK